MEAMGPHGDPMGSPWGPHGVPWDPWEPMDSHGNPWESMGIDDWTPRPNLQAALKAAWFDYETTSEKLKNLSKSEKTKIQETLIKVVRD